jgi:hypothetical protein
MKISELKHRLSNIEHIVFQQPNGQVIPLHFHITELGLTSKHFIDCGGTVRTEENASLQIWVAEDYEHRLSPEKLTGIIDKASALLEGKDLEVEIEYQTDTIGKYGLEYQGGKFVLQPKQTDCLAKEQCGLPVLETAVSEKSSCQPGGGCC